jgi:hypothetical protein
MTGTQTDARNTAGRSSRIGLLLIILGAVLLGLFHECLKPNYYVFSNDAPLGAMKAADNALPDVFSGRWVSLNWVGFETPSAAPDFSALSGTLLSPELLYKVYPPLCLMILGLSVWLFFRQLGFGPMTCLVGGVVAGLNMHFLSIACWGLGIWVLASASMFLTLAAMVSPAIRQPWTRAILAGLGVGLGVTEGFDIGAILSLFCGVFVVFTAWTGGAGLGRKVCGGIGMLGIVVLTSMVVAAHTVSSLYNTQIKGIAGVTPQAQAGGDGWNFSTQWSLPKAEALRVLIPGLFGYQMDAFIRDTNRSSAYWGRVGEDPNLPMLESREPAALRQVVTNLGIRADYAAKLTGSNPEQREEAIAFIKPNLQRRHSGSGEYAGILVSVIALFGLANGFRKDKPVFSTAERRAMVFWGVVALISLLLAFGRHGFLYRFLYELPYFSAIRNPVKFMYPFHIAWIILSGYGLEALSRQYLSNPDLSSGSASKTGLINRVRSWLRRMVGFDKKWVWGSLVAFALSGAAVLIAISARADIDRLIQAAGFPKDLSMATTLTASSVQITGFLLGELAWFLLFLGLSLALLILIMSGVLSGSRTRWAWACLLILAIVDLARSDWRWVSYYDFNHRYATNPVIEFLKDKPHEHRVTAEFIPMTRAPMTTTPNFFTTYYDMLQNQIPYLNIQTLDVIQMPRIPEFDKAYINTFRPTTNFFPCLRLWQLTNTRYVLASPNNGMRLRFGPEEGFVPRVLFNVIQKPDSPQLFGPEDITYEQTADGPVALYEYTPALPRARLYANWRTATTNESETLSLLASRDFDPLQTVIVAAETPIPPIVTPATSPKAMASTVAGAEANAGTVTIDVYKPKYVALSAHAETNAVLLLNDRTAPQWHAWIDGKPTPTLRLNYLMRGVFLSAGDHKVEFRFQPSLTTLYVSLGAWSLGLLVLGYVLIGNRSRSVAVTGTFRAAL